jgi:hypothetical protein
MPTASKLFSAAAFAIIGFIAAELYKTTMLERTEWGQLSLICAAIGLLCGWQVMGTLTGHGYRPSVGYGLRTSATMVFWILIGFSIYEMVKRSMNMRYNGPMEAVLGSFELAMEFAVSMASVPVIGTFAIGGVVGGALAEWVSRRWK